MKEYASQDNLGDNIYTRTNFLDTFRYFIDLVNFITQCSQLI